MTSGGHDPPVPGADDAAADRARAGYDAAGALRRRLDGLVARGRLSADQADLVAAELAGAPAGEGRARRRGVLVEAVGYLGAALVLAATALLGEELWADLTHWARTALLVLIALMLATAGRWVRPPGTVGAADRVAGTLWVLSTAAVAGAAAVAADWAAIADDQRLLLVGVVALMPAGLWWWLRPAALQLVVLFAAAGASVAGLLLAVDPDVSWAWALLVTAFGVAWLLLVWGGVLGPTRTGHVLGAAAAAVGPQTAGGDADVAAPAAGLVVAVALLAAGVAIRAPALAVIGTIATTGYLLELAQELLPGELGWMVGMLVAGAALLAGSLTALRTARSRPPAQGAGDD